MRFLSRANDTGTLAFAFNGDLYTMMPGEKPSLVQVDIVADDQETPEKLAVKPSQPLVSPDGKQAAFLSRGDVFVTSVEHPSTFQVTHTPAAERHLTWGADGRTLYYTSERSGRKAIYKATISGDDTPNFSNATTVLEEPFLTAEGEEDRSEYSHPTVSPDGKKMVYVKNRRELWVTDLPGKTNARQLTHGETYPGRDDEMNFSFSPDSRWLVMEMVPHMRDPYSDIALVELATGQVTNLTREAYFDSQPRFVLDGNAVLYFTDRYGLRSQASWGSQNDIMLVFLNRQAQDRFRLSDEDYALLKEAEKTSKKLPEVTATPKKKGKKDKAPVGTDKKSASEKEPIVVELDGIDKRVMRLSPFSGDFSDAVISPDGETLYALVDFAGEGYDLWKIPLRGDKKEPRQAAKMGARPSRFQVVEKDLFILGDKMQKLDTKGDKLTPVKAEAKLMVDNRSQRQAMYEYVVTEEEERFYDPAMHGVDWKALTDNYRQFLPSINNNTDFAEMLSELLGELNVSHTGGRYRGPSSPAMQPTATLGLLYDMSQPLGTDGTLTVQEVLSGGPFDRADSRMAPGARITAINGQPLEGGLEALNGLAGAKTQINFTLPSGEQVQEVVKPVSASRQYDLMYDRWVRSRAAAVDSLSNGRLGYVHISSMNDASFRPMYADLLGKYADREGVVIDIRWNGGGRMHEDIEQLFTGQKYLTQIIRGEEVCDMPSRRYNKPSVMLVAEPCYSNAHGTPWVYQHQKIGKVVGAPVAGTMTSVNWVTMQDPTLVFGIPVIGYRTAKGNYLENTQLEPDVVVYNTPEDIVAGRDTQLERAVQTLLDDIDAKK